MGGIFEVDYWFICWPQVVLDCPTDACFVYIYQYEPYLRDPVAYPKVQVRRRVGRKDHDSAMCRDPLSFFEEIQVPETQVHLAETRMELLSYKIKSVGIVSGMAGSRSSRRALSLGSTFFAWAPLPGGPLVEWQRETWAAPGFLLTYLATPELKHKSQVGSDWLSLNHIPIL